MLMSLVKTWLKSIQMFISVKARYKASTIQELETTLSLEHRLLKFIIGIIDE